MAVLALARTVAVVVLHRAMWMSHPFPRLPFASAAQVAVALAVVAATAECLTVLLRSSLLVEAVAQALLVAVARVAQVAGTLEEQAGRGRQVLVPVLAAVAGRSLRVALAEPEAARRAMVLPGHRSQVVLAGTRPQMRQPVVPSTAV